MMLQRAIESKFLFMMIEITAMNEGGFARSRSGLYGFFVHVAPQSGCRMRYTAARRSVAPAR
jgi:hypothetical protein